MREVNESLKSVTKMTKNLTETGQEVTLAARDSRVMVQNLSQQAIPNATQVISRLQSVAINLQALSSELTRNPSVILRGRQAPNPGPGER